MKPHTSACGGDSSGDTSWSVGNQGILRCCHPGVKWYHWRSAEDKIRVGGGEREREREREREEEKRGERERERESGGGGGGVGGGGA